jgi:threonyl-tRNA synthetase
LLILGEQETSEGSVTWQRYGTKERIKLGFDTFLTQFEAEIRNRSDWRITAN